MKKLFLIILISIIVFSCKRTESSNMTSDVIYGKTLDKLLKDTILPIKDSSEIKHFVMVIAPRAFRDEEFKIPYEYLTGLGHKIKVASRDTILATGLLGLALKPQITVKEIDTLAFDGMILVGGTGAAIYWDDLLLHQMIRHFSQRPHKLIAAICLAPITLARAGILTNKKATVFKDRFTLNEFKQKQVLYVESGVVISGNVITAASPQDADKFAKAIALKAMRLKSQL
ncbi:MAG: DJ-1/PfpI family protein [candidate division WOR-3 bacterium]